MADSASPLSPADEPEAHTRLSIVSPAVAPVTISFENLSYTVEIKRSIPITERLTSLNWCCDETPADKKVFLDGITGTAKPGTMTALMGPSGAGKSTLLDVIAGLKNSGEIGGDLSFNGRPRPADFKRMAGYVQQEDILMATLTVRETLYFAAELRLEQSLPAAERAARVVEVLEELGLEGCADTVIGGRLRRGISGGQAKRVNMGLELITRPSILFLDEPTSGLDSATSYDVMKVVRDLCQRGRTVICTIHQPSTETFRLFNKLLLLVAGRLVYLGDVSSAIDYFVGFGFEKPPSMNPAEFLVSVTGPGTGQEESLVKGPIVDEHFFAREWAKSTLASLRLVSAAQAAHVEPLVLVPARALYANGVFHEFVTLVRRTFRGRMRDSAFFAVGLGKNLTLSLIMMTIYLNSPSTFSGMRDLFSVMFLTIVIIGLSAFDHMSGLLEDRVLYYRENGSACYRPISYFLSSWVVDLPFSLLGTVVFSVVLYYAVGFNPAFEAFIYFNVMLAVTQEIGVTFGQVIACVSRNLDMATAAMNTVFTIWILFSGFGINPASMPKFWLWAYYTSFFRYAMEGLSGNEFDGRWFGVCGTVINGTCAYDPSAVNPDSQPFCLPRDGVVCEFSGSAFSMSLFDGTLINKWLCVLIVIGLDLGFRLLGYLALVHVRYDKR
eukprot:Opistho-2@5738